MADWLNKTFYTIDHSIAKFFHLLQVNCGSFSTPIMEFISILGKSGIAMLLIALVLCVFPKTRKMGVCVILSIAISALITSIIIKPIVARARPYESGGDFYSWWVDAGKHIEDSYSFPSGHSTASMAFAFSIFAFSKHKKVSWLIFLFPMLMAISRIYLMVHYFSDCLFGLVVGEVSAFVSYFIVKLIFEKTKGKFHNFINNFDPKDWFCKNKKESE